MKLVHLASLLFGATLATAASAAALEITVGNVQGTDGLLMLAIYDAAGWRSTPILTAAQPAAAPVFRFPDLGAGAYGIAVFHDRNGNGRLDTNLMGVPTEPYGFSRRGAPGMGPPAWDDAKFDLPSGGARVDVQLSN